MFIVDAHLDLAYNALRGRNVLAPAAEQAPEPDDIPTVGLPDLRRGGVGLICATIFCLPKEGNLPGYDGAEQAHTAALAQLHWYQEQARAGEFRFLTSRRQLHELDATGRAINALLLLEGADPIRSTDELPFWFEQGLRLIGLAWHRTRFAGGTGAPGPLTDDGIALVKAMDQLGMIHDTSHLAEESFWQLLELATGPVIASHSNCRSIVPTDRQLSNEMIRALVKRGGVIGLNFFDRFLLPADEYGKRRARLDDLVAHAVHVCELAGNADHVALGTDMDGGLGREQIPEEIASSADLPNVAAALGAAGFSEHEIANVMGRNWLRFFSAALPE